MLRLVALLLHVAWVSLVSLVFEGAKVWLLIRPYRRFKAWRAKRRGERMAIDLGTRTSTNALVGGGLFSQIYIQLVALLPGEGAVETLLMQPESVAFVAVLFATLVARFSRTPAVPGKL